MTEERLSIGSAEFWRRPLEDRMADFAVLRQEGPFTPDKAYNLLTDDFDDFYAVTRYADVVEISRHPQDFCSGQGSTGIQDMPPEALEFFGSFIAMDDPKHARQRGIVAPVVHAAPPAGRARFGRADLHRGHRRHVRAGGGRPGRDHLPAVPAPRDLRHDGHPPQRVQDGARRHQRDPWGRRSGDDGRLRRHHRHLLQRRHRSHAADGRDRRRPPEEPPGRPHLGPRPQRGRRGDARPERDRPVLHPPGRRRQRTRTAISAGMHLLAQNPDQRKLWQDDLDGTTATAVDEIVRVASPVTFMRRTVTHDLTLSDQQLSEGDKLILFYGAANRDPAVFPDPDRFDVRRDPNPHVGFGGPGPHFCLGAHLARRELSVIFRQLLTRLPDIETTGDPVLLEAMGVPLVGGIKRLPVRFTPTARVGTGA